MQKERRKSQLKWKGIFPETLGWMRKKLKRIYIWKAEKWSKLEITVNAEIRGKGGYQPWNEEMKKRVGGWWLHLPHTYLWNGWLDSFLYLPSTSPLSMGGFASLSVGLSCRVASVFHIYLCVCEPICLYSCIGKKRRRRRNGAVLCSFMLATCNFSGYIVRHKYHYTGDASFPHLSLWWLGAVLKVCTWFSFILFVHCLSVMFGEKEPVYTHAFSSFLAASHFLDSEGRKGRNSTRRQTPQSHLPGSGRSRN